MRVFVTGFGPFGQVEENPSSFLAEASGRPHQILEVSYAAVDHFLANEFPRDQFQALLMLGVSGRAKAPQFEMYGVNGRSKHPDVQGVVGAPIIEAGGPASMRSTLWTPDAFRHPAFQRSTSAGRYLCNYALYRALRALPDHKVGFIHVPLAETMDLNDQLVAIKELLSRIESR